MKEREEELERLKKEVGEFPARLLKETEAAALRGRIDAEVKLEQQIVVLKKDAETERRLAELRVKTLEEALAHNTTQIAALDKQLADAKQRGTGTYIALKAIEGASGARALSRIKSNRDGTGRTRPQG